MNNDILRIKTIKTVKPFEFGLLKGFKFKLMTFIVLFSIILGGTVVYAARFLTYGWPSNMVPMEPYYYNDFWQTPMDQSLLNWNGTSTPILFYKSSDCGNDITAAQFAWSAYGRTYTTYSGSELLEFDIELNSRTISDDATNFSNFVQSVFVHELGHTIWLGDDPDTTDNSIMKHDRDRDTLTDPTSYDEDSVNEKY